MSRTAAARAAIGEAGQGSSALVPAALAAGAGTGSGGTSDDEREPYSLGEYQGKSGDPDQDIGPLTPAIKKEAVALAKAEIPKEERKGFGYEDLMMFGLQMMAGKSQYALQNVGEAGVAALASKQAREKTEYDRRKTDADITQSAAMSKYYGAAADRYAREDRPQMQYQKAIDKAVADAVASMAYQLAKTPAEKAQLEANARARAKASFLSVYPELADTMEGAGPSLDLTQWGTPAKT